jgi:hypothetical protein
MLYFPKGDDITLAELTKPSSDLIANLKGRLPSTPDEIHEALRLGEEAIKEGRTVPAEEVVEKMRRVWARHKVM